MSVEYRIDNKVIVSFTDTLLLINNLSTFKREIKNQILYFNNNYFIKKNFILFQV